MRRKVGFTGASGGATPRQLRHLKEHLVRLSAEGFNEFHHGLCVGADEQAAEIAQELGFRVVAHPGLAADTSDLEFRSRFSRNDEVLEAKPFAFRDRDIVDATERLLAVPSTQTEDPNSGTWATVRYAKEQQRPVDLFLPQSE
jgi:hypothetical protein